MVLCLVMIMIVFFDKRHYAPTKPYLKSALKNVCVPCTTECFEIDPNIHSNAQTTSAITDIEEVIQSEIVEKSNSLQSKYESTEHTKEAEKDQGSIPELSLGVSYKKIIRTTMR